MENIVLVYLFLFCVFLIILFILQSCSKSKKRVLERFDPNSVLCFGDTCFQEKDIQTLTKFSQNGQLCYNNICLNPNDLERTKKSPETIETKNFSVSNSGTGTAILENTKILNNLDISTTKDSNSTYTWRIAKNPDDPKKLCLELVSSDGTASEKNNVLICIDPKTWIVS